MAHVSPGIEIRTNDSGMRTHCANVHSQGWTHCKRALSGDDTAGTIQLYEDIINQAQVQEALLGLLDHLGIPMPPEEGIPPAGVFARKVRVQASAMQLASDAKSTLAEKATASAEKVHTSTVQAEAMAKWRVEQATRLAEDKALASKELVDSVASSTQVVLADGSERLLEVAEDVRDCLLEKAEATRAIVAEKADDAVGFWQDTGKWSSVLFETESWTENHVTQAPTSRQSLFASRQSKDEAGGKVGS